MGVNGVEWFPWQGGRVLQTLQLYAKADGFNTERDGLRLRYQGISVEQFITHRQRVTAGAFTGADLVESLHDLQRDRFDEYVPESLLQKAFIEEVLDLSKAQASARA